MSSRGSRDWRVLLLAVVGGAGALLCVGLATATAGYALVEPWLHPLARHSPEAQDVKGILVLAGGMAMLGGVLIATFVAAVRSLRGRIDPRFESKALRWWEIFACAVVWLGASAMAQLLHDRDGASFTVPLLHIIAIGSPIYLLSRLAIAQIQGGSRLRLWGSVTSGMLLGTGLAAGIEIVLLLAAATAGALYLIANPHQVIELQRLAAQLGGGEGAGGAMAALGPFLTSPFAFALALAAVAVATPLVEEIAKSVPVWAQRDHLHTGAHGFWAGALSGAGFALFEGIIVSAGASGGLAFILVLRAGSSLMHIVASGLSGWGIGVFRSTGSKGRAVAGYAGAMAVHSFWNAAVVAIGYGGIRTTYGARQPDPAGLVLSMGGGLLLMALVGLLPVALLGLNMRFRRRDTAASAAASLEIASQSASAAQKANKVS